MNLLAAIAFFLFAPAAGAGSTGTVKAADLAAPGAMTLFGNKAVVDGRTGENRAGLKAERPAPGPGPAGGKTSPPEEKSPKKKLKRVDFNTKLEDGGGCKKPCPCMWAVGTVLKTLGGPQVPPVTSSGPINSFREIEPPRIPLRSGKMERKLD